MSKRMEAEQAHQAVHGTYLTYEEFLEQFDEDSLAEWVDGQVEMSSPASSRHQDIMGFLLATLPLYVEAHGLGKVIGPPFQMKLPYSGREPDLIYVAAAHLDRIKNTYIDGPADLAVEIVSDESVTRDRDRKFREYQDGGVSEYWLIDPRTEQDAFYQLDDHGRYQLVPADTTGVYRSRAVPGFWLRVDWLWQQPPPNLIPTLLQIDRDAYGRYLQEQLRQAGL